MVRQLRVEPRQAERRPFTKLVVERSGGAEPGPPERVVPDIEFTECIVGPRVPDVVIGLDAVRTEVPPRERTGKKCAELAVSTAIPPCDRRQAGIITADRVVSTG